MPITRLNQLSSEQASKDLQFEIEILEFQLSKAELNHHNYTHHQVWLKEKTADLESQIEAAQKDITRLENELALESQKRQNRMEYDSIGGLILEYKDTAIMNEYVLTFHSPKRFLAELPPFLEISTE